jgi:hypothetical protein
MDTKNGVLVIALLALISIPAFAQSGLDYFKGTWTVAIKDGPKGGFRWDVNTALDGSWLGGSVTREGKSVTNDYWREDGKKIERFAFTANGLFVRIASAGWSGDKLIFAGTAGSAAGESNVRETIAKIDANKFLALWERQGPDGKWSVFSDETCVRVVK